MNGIIFILGVPVVAFVLLLLFRSLLLCIMYCQLKNQRAHNIKDWKNVFFSIWMNNLATYQPAQGFSCSVTLRCGLALSVLCSQHLVSHFALWHVAA